MKPPYASYLWPVWVKEITAILWGILATQIDSILSIFFVGLFAYNLGAAIWLLIKIENERDEQ